jgi:CheY-like chemotaxis protein
MNYLILLVEDDPVTSIFIKDMLGSAFTANVHILKDNDSALRFAHARKPDLIITDIYHVGKGTGIDLFRAIRSDKNISSIPIIILSGQAKEDIELKLYREGIKGVLRKPCRSDELITIVARALEDKADPDVILLNLGYETIDLDYKEDIDLSRKDERASLAKDVIAMANTLGGTIIIGVAEPAPGRFEKIGLNEDRLKSFEATKIGNALRKYIGSVVSVSVRRVMSKSKYYVLIKVPVCDGTIAMACCDNEHANLYQGRIYVSTAVRLRIAQNP